MNENKLKNIINELVGFEKKFIEVAGWKEGTFGGLKEVIFAVKGELYSIKINDDDTFTFDFVPEEPQDEAQPDSDRDYMHEKYEGHVSRETSEPVEAEAVTEA